MKKVFAQQSISAKQPNKLFEKIAPQIVRSLNRRSTCTLGISGGRFIPGLLKAIMPYAKKLRSTIYVVWIDERVRREKNANEAIPFLQQLAAAGVKIQWQPITAVSATAAKRQADKAIGRGGFDVIIASAGEDGHIASLFPNKTINTRANSYLIVRNAPKPPALRVTASPKLLSGAKVGFLFFVGDKKKAYHNFSDPTVTKIACPAKLFLLLPELYVCDCLK